jgi:hypothetical protein
MSDENLIDLVTEARTELLAINRASTDRNIVSILESRAPNLEALLAICKKMAERPSIETYDSKSGPVVALEYAAHILCHSFLAEFPMGKGNTNASKFKNLILPINLRAADFIRDVMQSPPQDLSPLGLTWGWAQLIYYCYNMDLRAEAIAALNAIKKYELNPNATSKQIDAALRAGVHLRLIESITLRQPRRPEAEPKPKPKPDPRPASKI